MNSKKVAFASILVVALIVVIANIVLLNKKEASTKTESTSEHTENSTIQSTEGNDIMTYTSITMDEAKEIFKTSGDYIILDVRTATEFADGHIPGAINIANEDIIDTEPEALPDKNQTIYIYCRSGRRSKEASSKLVAMGYSNIIEFGGILDWTGEVEK